MAVLALLFIILAMATSSGATWCVCRSELSDSVLQKTIDYACGAGADCSPLLQNGPCFNPNTVKAHCSYAANSYFQRKGQAQGTCDFAGSATIVTTDPSPAGTSCVFPSSGSSAGTTPPGTPTTPSTTPPGTTPPGTTTPSTGLTPPTGIIGGSGSSLGPIGVNPDGSGGALHTKAEMGSLHVVFWISCLVLLRG
ncbi:PLASMODESMATA CALLOSE-BINDING PROTEIN 3-like [Magnolia sinica]|uniref:PLASMODESMATA CALLOSE-BINDING PROTEIN 3-like n=1 Tax=Magnolia sinica TaxID=86752 RepID=UPI00265AA2A8|nr:PLASMODESMATA CALLOSE-BINDING PROTEIN 3-like [Magnolia sinica]